MTTPPTNPCTRTYKNPRATINSISAVANITPPQPFKNAHTFTLMGINFHTYGRHMKSTSSSFMMATGLH